MASAPAWAAPMADGEPERPAVDPIGTGWSGPAKERPRDERQVRPAGASGSRPDASGTPVSGPSDPRSCGGTGVAMDGRRCRQGACTSIEQGVSQ